MAFTKSKSLIFTLVIFALASLAFSPLIAHAASTTPAKDSVGTAQEKSSVSSVSWNHTVGNFSNRLLVVGISVNGSKTVSSVTYGSQNLIRLDKISYGSNTLDDEVWYAINPAVGAGTVKVILSGSANVVADSASFYNVNQTTPFGTDAKASGKGLSATVNIPSGSNQLVLDILGSDTMLGNFQPATGQTALWNGFSNFPQSGASIKPSSGTSTTMTWADSQSDNWGEIGVALLPVATTPTPTVAPTAIPTAIPTSLPTATPTPVPTYTLSGTVYNDNNQNGVQDTGETGYQGATVSLSTGQITTTDANGNYAFANLQSGTYTETLTVPSGYRATTTTPATVAVGANTTQNFGIAPVPTSIPTNTPTPTSIPTPTSTPTATPTPTTGPITQDSVGIVQEKSSVSSVSWNHTVGNFTNRLLVVGVSVNGGKTVSSVTYGSQNLTRLDSISYGSGSLDNELWYGVNPGVGTAAVTVKLSAAANIVTDSVSFYNVNQTTPFGTDAKASGKGVTATVNVPSGSNQVLLDVLGSDTTLGNFQPATGQTALWNGFTNTPQSGASIKASSGATTVMTWTDTQSDNWALIGTALQPASVSPTPTPMPTATPTPGPTVTPTPTPNCGQSTGTNTPPPGSSYGNNALSQWNCALTNRTTAPATWVALGDSITEGQGSSTVAGRWANQTLTDLRSKYSVSGVTGGFGYIPAFYGTYGPDSQWSTDPTLSGNASENKAIDDGNDGQLFGNGAGLGMLTVTLQSGGSETFKVNGSSIDILYNYGSGTFSYAIDSGTATTVSTSGSTGATGSTHVDFLSSGSHTVTINGVSGSVILEGIMTYNGDETNGIRQYVGAQSGTTSGDFAAQAQNMAAIIANIKADLVTIEIGTNDYNRSSGTPMQTITNIKSLVSDIRSAATGHEPSIVIVNVYPVSGGNDAQGYPDSAYRSAIQSVATDDPSLGYLDFSALGVTGGQPSPYLSSTDNEHPSDAGQTQLANIVESYLEDK